MLSSQQSSSSTRSSPDADTAPSLSSSYASTTSSSHSSSAGPGNGFSSSRGGSPNTNPTSNPFSSLAWGTSNPQSFCAFDGPASTGEVGAFARRTSTPQASFLAPRFWPSGSLASPHAGVVAAAAQQHVYPLGGPSVTSAMDGHGAAPVRRSSFANLSSHRLGGAFSALGMTAAAPSKGSDSPGNHFSPLFPALSAPSGASTPASTPASSPSAAHAELDSFRRSNTGVASSSSSAVAEDDLPPLASSAQRPSRGMSTSAASSTPSTASQRRDSSRKRHMCFPDGMGGTFFVEQKERRRTASSSQV